MESNDYHCNNRSEGYYDYRREYDRNHIEVKPDGSYKGDVRNLGDAFDYVLWLMGGILVLLGLYNRSEDSRKESHARNMADIEVDKERRIQEVRAQAKTQPQKPDIEDAEVIGEVTQPLPSETLTQTLNKELPQVPVLVGGLIRGGERVVIFSPTNQGKSILSMQMAIDIAGGTTSELVEQDDVHPEQEVFIYDAEQDDFNIKQRYGGYDEYPENLHRVSNCSFGKISELIKDIEHRLHNTSVSRDVTVVIDNLTAISSDMSAEDSRLFIEELKRLKMEMLAKGHFLTFIIVGHAIKTDDYSTPSLSFLRGSSNLTNLADSVFALWPTNLGEEYKMLKIAKARCIKRDGTVIVLRRISDPYLHFEFERRAAEEDVLPKSKAGKGGSVEGVSSDEPGSSKAKVSAEDIERMKELRAENKTLEEIGKEFGVAKSTVSKILNPQTKKKKKK